jgi:hypothetical protein
VSATEGAQISCSENQLPYDRGSVSITETRLSGSGINSESFLCSAAGFGARGFSRRIAASCRSLGLSSLLSRLSQARAASAARALTCLPGNCGMGGGGRPFALKRPARGSRTDRVLSPRCRVAPRGFLASRGRHFQAGPSRLRQTYSDRLFRRAGAMPALAYMLGLFVHIFPGAR